MSSHHPEQIPFHPDPLNKLLSLDGGYLVAWGSRDFTNEISAEQGQQQGNDAVDLFCFTEEEFQMAHERQLAILHNARKVYDKSQG